MFQRGKIKAFNKATAQTSTVHERRDDDAYIDFAYAGELGMRLADDERALAAGPAWIWVDPKHGECEGTVLVTDVHTMLYWLDPVVRMYLNVALRHDHVENAEAPPGRPNAVMIAWRDPDFLFGLRPRLGDSKDDARRAGEWSRTLHGHLSQAIVTRYQARD